MSASYRDFSVTGLITSYNYTSNNFNVYVFTSGSGNVYFNTTYPVGFLLVGGGGGGGGCSSNSGWAGGGGGGGGFITTGVANMLTNTSYPIAVGSGGTSGTAYYATSGVFASSGNSSIFGTYTASGGFGGFFNSNTANSGGGITGLATNMFGGNLLTASGNLLTFISSGNGGNGGVTTNLPGNAGNGVPVSSLGLPIQLIINNNQYAYLAGGGGGGSGTSASSTPPSPGGLGGGGNGSVSSYNFSVAGNGLPNTGGGGGGASCNASASFYSSSVTNTGTGIGGSGVVVFYIPISPPISPTSLAIVSSSSTTITLSFIAPTNGVIPSGYISYINALSDSVTIVNGSGTPSSFTLYNLTPLTTYRDISIASTYYGLNSAFSNALTTPIITSALYSTTGPDTPKLTSFNTGFSSLSFTTPGTYTFIPTKTMKIGYLVVAGGGGSQRSVAAGSNGISGSGGGSISYNVYSNSIITLTLGTSYTITVGSGGVGTTTTAGTGGISSISGTGITPSIVTSGGSGSTNSLGSGGAAGTITGTLTIAGAQGGTTYGKGSDQNTLVTLPEVCVSSYYGGGGGSTQGGQQWTPTIPSAMTGYQGGIGGGGIGAYWVAGSVAGNGVPNTGGGGGGTAYNGTGSGGQGGSGLVIIYTLSTLL